MGKAAEEGSTVSKLATTAGELTNYGRAAVAFTTGMVGAASNKIITGRSNFSWASVAAASVTAGMGGRLPGEAWSASGFASDIGMGLMRSGVSYGVNRVFGGNQSWNNANVAADVFGNAIGNSIVGGIQRSEAEKNNRNRYIEAMGQKLTADTARKIDRQLATDLNNSLNTTMQGVDASVERMMSANNRNQQIDTNAQFASR